MIEVRITFLRLGDTVDSTFNFPLCLSVGQQQSLLLRTELSVMGQNKALPLICLDLGRLTGSRQGKVIFTAKAFSRSNDYRSFIKICTAQLLSKIITLIKVKYSDFVGMSWKGRNNTTITLAYFRKIKF